jgi:protein ImuA
MSSNPALRPASAALAAPFASSALARPDSFEDVRAAAARAPLTEILPAAPGDEAAALAFALGWMSASQPPGLIVWIAPARLDPEYGAPCPEGLAQFGLALDRLLLVRPHTLEETLWATEEALSAPGVAAFAILPPATRPVSLTVTRRLLLRAEQRATRGVLLRLDPPASTAAWTRWRIASAASQGEGRELGPPAVRARLDRNRAGPAGAEWTLVWTAHEHRFHATNGAMAGALVPATGDRPAAAHRSRAA